MFSSLCVHFLVSSYLKVKQDKMTSIIGVSFSMCVLLMVSHFTLTQVFADTESIFSLHNTNMVSHNLNPQFSGWEKSITLIWQDNSTGNDEIYLRKSVDG